MDKLLWFDNWGVGYYPVTDTPYDKDYWEKYIGYEQTEIGKRLNNHRTNLVNFYTASQLVDIGIGSGMFIKEFDDALGLDINPCAVQWLKEKDRLWDKTPIGCMTFWDSLEHIHNPTELLSLATDFVFVSCPIYTDRNHVLRSKHFRPDEHCWYFTYDGAVSFMRNFGFYLVEYNRMEEDCGREDIGTFVFKRLK